MVWFTYIGVEDEVIPSNATHILVQARVILRCAFANNRKIVEVICDDKVEKIEEGAFEMCTSLRRVIMRGVRIVGDSAFGRCGALADIECDKLEIIEGGAFCECDSLRSINLPSARIIKYSAFWDCKGLMSAMFTGKLERIEEEAAFGSCESLQQITIPLKDGFFSDTWSTFIECYHLRQVNLVEGELHETIAALHLEEWKNEMASEINSINQILPGAYAGEWNWGEGCVTVEEEKTQTIQRWIRSVLRKISHYQVDHQRLLNEAAMTLRLALPNEIVMNNVLPFLQLPSYTFS